MNHLECEQLQLMIQWRTKFRLQTTWNKSASHLESYCYCMD